MKKIFLAAVMVAGIAAASALAQTGGMDGQKHEGMGVQHSSQMMSGQMTGEEMFRDMARTLKQMNELMQKMTHPMEHITVTEHAKMLEMATVMHEMATQMHELATNMEKDRVDRAAVKKLLEKMKETHRALETREKRK